jgi:hypothetical protein
VAVSEGRCPTCDGSGYIARNGHGWPCPTCSPSAAGAPALRSDDDIQTGILRYVRWSASFVGAVAFVVMVALLIKFLWN